MTIHTATVAVIVLSALTADMAGAQLAPLTQTNGFVRITDGEPPSSAPRFEAKGSLVGSTLTLFPGYSFLDGSHLPSPIVSRAQ